MATPPEVQAMIDKVIAETDAYVEHVDQVLAKGKKLVEESNELLRRTKQGVAEIDEEYAKRIDAKARQHEAEMDELERKG